MSPITANLVLAPHVRTLVVALALVALPGTVQGQAPAPPDLAEVQAIFAEHCVLCHGGAAPTLGLDLSSLAGARTGSDRGPVVVPGDPDASELILRVRGEALPRMPLTGPPWLDDGAVALLSAWVAAGAPTTVDAAEAPSESAPAAPAAPATAVPASGTFADVDRILSGRCAYCHMPDGAMGAAPEGLVLTTHEARLAGGDRAVVLPGAPLASELYRRVAGLGTPRMPFDGPPWLADADIASVRTWIETGAPGPDGTPAPIPVGREVRYEGILTGRWELDGMPFELVAGARIEDAPSTGDRVEVRGVVTADGRIRATRIRAR